MMLTPKNPYKKLPCRHFDEHSGKPLSPCIKGKDCRFLHPSDFEWQRRKANKKPYRSAPLAPQSDVFLRSHRDELSSNSRIKEECDSSRGLVGLKYRKRSRSPDRDRSSYQSTPTPLEKERPATESSSRQENQRQLQNTRVRVVANQIKISTMSPASKASSAQPVTLPHSTPLPASVDIQSSEKVVQLFQSLASIARETDQLTEAQKKEEAKTQTYKDISATLKSITSAAGSVVAPQIARSLLAQTDYKNQIEKNNAACRRMWGDAMCLFAGEVTRVVDNHVQAALRSIKNEAEQAALSVATIGKRKRDSEDDDAKETYGGEESQDKGTSRNFKRQKQSAGNVGAKELSSGTETDGGALIREMKFKIEEQARAIVKLAQENNELRTVLGKELGNTPCTPRFGKQCGRKERTT